MVYSLVALVGETRPEHHWLAVHGVCVPVMETEQGGFGYCWDKPNSETEVGFFLCLWFGNV